VTGADAGAARRVTNDLLIFMRASIEGGGVWKGERGV